MSGIAFCSHRETSSKDKKFHVNVSILPMRHEDISNKSLKEKGSVINNQFGTNLNKNLNTLKIEFTGTLKTNG